MLQQQTERAAPTKLARHGIVEWKAIETCGFLRRAPLFTAQRLAQRSTLRHSLQPW